MVLNLVINGLPSILSNSSKKRIVEFFVLNLVINGLPSILARLKSLAVSYGLSFKPCYKWITFNTEKEIELAEEILDVLNLVINGLPSIHKNWYKSNNERRDLGFKPCYKWITFNTFIKYLYYMTLHHIGF